MRGRDRRGCATALHNFIRDSHRTVPENCAEREQIPVTVDHDAPIDAGNRFQNGLRNLRDSLTPQKIVKLIFRSRLRRRVLVMKEIASAE